MTSAPERLAYDGPLEDTVLVVDLHGSGTGVPVVWLHSEWGSYDDPPFAEDVLSAARVFVIHHPGWGVSEGGSAFDSLGALALAYWWLLDQLGLEEAVIAGHGLGASLAAEMAVQQPQRVKSLLLVSPFGIFDPEHPGSDIFALMARDVLPDLYAKVNEAPATTHYPKPADAHESGLVAIRRAEVLGSASRYLFPIPDTGLADRAYRLKDVDTHLLWGALDGVIPPALAVSWQELLPMASTQVVEGAAHMLPYESEAVSAVLRSLVH